MIDPMLIAFCFYFSMLLGIGIYFYNKTQSSSDFASANRSFNYWLTAIAAQASDMSDWIFMAFPGAIFLYGFSSIWVAISLALFMFLTWQYIAPRLREQTEQYNSLTLSSFFQKRFNDSSSAIKIISGLLCMYFFTYYIAAGIVGFGKAFEIIFNIPYQQGICAGFIISLLYTLLGGLIAVTWSNLLQGLFLLGCIIIVPWYAINTQLSGIHDFYTKLLLLDSKFLSFWPSGGIFATFMAILKWGPGYFGQPHILINFMTINNAKNIHKAKWLGLSWQILVLSAAIMVGLVGKIIFAKTLCNPELVFIVMVKTLFTPFTAGLILCSVLAATVSTINIQSLICATFISQDLLMPLFKFSQNKDLLITRCAIFIIPTISLLISFNPIYQQDPQAVMNLVLFAWSGLAVTFGPIVMLSLYTKKHIHRYGVLAGLCVGALTAILWPLNHVIPVMVTGYCMNLMTVVFCSNIYRRAIQSL